MKQTSKWTVMLAVLLSVLMLLAACAGGADQTPAEDKTTQTSAAQETAEAEPETSAVPQDSEAAQEQPAETSEAYGDDIISMLPVFDSVIRAVKANDGVYAPKDEMFFWTTLYLLSANYGEQTGKAEFAGDGKIKVARQAMQELASACFGDYSDLLNVPDELSQTVVYDESIDAYILEPSDIGDSSSQIVDAIDVDGTTQVAVILVSGEEVENYMFVIIPNPYVDAVSNPVFRYTIREAKPVE